METKDPDQIIRRHTILAASAGLIPVPYIDIASVTAIQLDMLRQLSKHYGADFSEDMGKSFVTALSGGLLARMGGSLVKSIPGIGSIIGGVSVAVFSGASTYAVGQVAKNQFENDENLIDINIERAKKLYEQALERGKAYVKECGSEAKASQSDIVERLRQLSEAREKDLISEEEYRSCKDRILSEL